MHYRWDILGNLHSKEDFVDLLLKNRGVSNKEEFLNPLNPLVYLKRFPREFKQNLIGAKKLILETIKDKRSIVIHGDYDADGVCGTAILYNTIKYELGYDNVFAFIPNRFEHGYGLSKESVDAVLERVMHEKAQTFGPFQGGLLFITVDSGITSAKEVEYIKSLGHKVIITDHHQKPDPLPKADCIVWSDRIVGASIAWVLSKTLGSQNADAIGLAALATITDVQPVFDMNRAIVKTGLEVLNENPPLGIEKLLEVSGYAGRNLSTYELGWVLGPRVNASGRVEDAMEALRLLTEKEPKAITQLAWKLNRINVERQDKTVEMYDLADISDYESVPKVIISSHADYHEGIIGLVASRLVKKYYRPSIVISLGEEHGKGSVRSIPGIDIISVLREFEDLFINLGGHPMAAGFTIHKENLGVLKENLTNFFETNFTDNALFKPSLDIDLKIPLVAVDLKLLEEIDKLRPFGVGNKDPLFFSENVGLAGLNVVGRENNHVSMRLFDGLNTHKAIFFRGSERMQGFDVGDKVDIVFSLKENLFNGRRSVDLVIKDIRPKM